MQIGNIMDIPTVLLIVVGILVVIGVALLSTFSKQKQPKPFDPTIAGTVSEVSSEMITQFITDFDPDQVRAIVIMSPDTFKRKQRQMGRAMELYSLIDERLFPKIYENIFKGAQDNIASADDLGGILLSHYNGNRLEVYTMMATKIGDPIVTDDHRFNSTQQAVDSINRFYNRIRRNFDDYLVVIVSGPNLTDLDDLVYEGETVLYEDSDESESDNNEEDDNDDDTFGMYDSSLSSWLNQHPSGSSVDRYTRHNKQQIQNVSSVNNAMPPPSTDYITYNDHTRFQTPRHHSPTTNPDFAGYIRTTDTLNLGGVATNKAEPFATDQQ